MMFVEKPNLPCSVKTVLLGEKYLELREALCDIGISVISVPSNTMVDERLSFHADLSVFHAGADRIFLSKHLMNSSFEEKLNNLGFDIIYPDVLLEKSYPHDCAFNICSTGTFAFCNHKTMAKEILSQLKACDTQIISCNQGYSKCLCCVVDENAIISSDKGIISACREKGIETLEISQGFIQLEGFEYGFIGGACFKLAKDTMAFTGHLDEHPDKSKIISFLGSRGVKAVFLTDKKIFDVGSIIPIMEKQR